MTTATRVTIRPVTPTPEAIEEVKSGLKEALMAMDTAQWDGAYEALTDDEHTPDAVFAFEPTHQAVVDEVAPQVARLLADALNRRLPWTWEPER